MRALAIELSSPSSLVMASRHILNGSVKSEVGMSIPLLQVPCAGWVWRAARRLRPAPARRKAHAPEANQGRSSSRVDAAAAGDSIRNSVALQRPSDAHATRVTLASSPL